MTVCVHVLEVKLPLSSLVGLLIIAVVVGSESVLNEQLQPFSLDFVRQNAIENRQLKNELMKEDSCWQKPLARKMIATHCGSLTDEGRTRIAIAITNCHLEASGIPTFECDAAKPVKECTVRIGGNQLAFTTYTTFYSQVDVMCFFMQKDLFTASTQRAVDSLIKATSGTAVILSGLGSDAARLLASVQDGHNEIAKHVRELSKEEEERFRKLKEAVGDVQLNIVDVATQQMQLKDNLLSTMATQMDIKQTADEINKKQDGVIERAEKLDDALIRLHSTQTAAFVSAASALADLRSRTDNSFAELAAHHDTLATRANHAADQLDLLSKAAAGLKDGQARLVAEADVVTRQLSSVREQVLGVATEILKHISELRMEFFLLFSIMFWPLVLFIIVLVTCFKRTAPARPLMVLLWTIGFALELGLARVAGVDYIGHAAIIRPSISFLCGFVLLAAVVMFKDRIGQIKSNTERILSILAKTQLGDDLPNHGEGSTQNSGMEGLYDFLRDELHTAGDRLSLARYIISSMGGGDELYLAAPSEAVVDKGCDPQIVRGKKPRTASKHLRWPGAAGETTTEVESEDETDVDKELRSNSSESPTPGGLSGSQGIGVAAKVRRPRRKQNKSLL